jgi:hypothetical protein
MSTASRLRTLSFFDFDGRLWGAALHGSVPVLTLGTVAGTRSAIGSESIDWSVEDERWQLTGDGFELTVTPAPDADPSGHELCQVRGHWSFDGAEHTVDCLGARTNGDPEVELQGLDSLRSVSAWFESDEGLMLLSVRPKGAAGHERDRLTAAVFEHGSSVPVNDARLSTTYTAQGLPTRASLELWLGDGETEHLWRAAGEAVAPAADVAHDGLGVRVEPFRWHSKGREGPGVYLLARPA